MSGKTYTSFVLWKLKGQCIARNTAFVKNESQCRALFLVSVNPLCDYKVISKVIAKVKQLF